jgi:hypothetical protein
VDQNLILILLLFVLFIVVKLFYTLLQISKSISASKWPTVKGQIVYSGVEDDTDSEGGTYRPYIEYKYNVQDREYTSTRYAFGSTHTSFKFLSRRIARNFPAKSVTLVAYNSRNHSDSVLLTGLRFFHIVQILFLGIILCFIYFKLAI